MRHLTYVSLAPTFPPDPQLFHANLKLWLLPTSISSDLLRLSDLVNVSVQIILPDILLVPNPRRVRGPLSFRHYSVEVSSSKWAFGLQARVLRSPRVQYGRARVCRWFSEADMKRLFESLRSSTWGKEGRRFHFTLLMIVSGPLSTFVSPAFAFTLLNKLLSQSSLVLSALSTQLI